MTSEAARCLFVASIDGQPIRCSLDEGHDLVAGQRGHVLRDGRTYERVVMVMSPIGYAIHRQLDNFLDETVDRIVGPLT